MGRSRTTAFPLVMFVVARGREVPHKPEVYVVIPGDIFLPAWMRHDTIPATVAAKASPAGGIGPNGPACFEQGGRHCWCIIGNPESLAHEVDIAGFDFQSEQRC